MGRYVSGEKVGYRSTEKSGLGRVKSVRYRNTKARPIDPSASEAAMTSPFTKEYRRVN